jgi:hypothetical protein
MTHLRRRLKALEKTLQNHDEMCTLEHLCRVVWRQDQKAFRKMAEYSSCSLLIPQFEREDAERRARK